LCTANVICGKYTHNNVRIQAFFLYASEKKIDKLCEGDVWSFKNDWQIAADGCILILDLHAPVKLIIFENWENCPFASIESHNINMYNFGFL
jgi:hypothetical protein